jgi:N-acetylneuraminic acid mutarotase
MGTNGWGFDDIYSYDPSSDTWTLLANYPGNGFNDVGGFHIDEKIYAGMGSNNVDLAFTDFWEFDRATGLWEEMQPSPIKLSPSISITVGNKGYIGYGWYSLSPEDIYMGRRFYEFDPGKN